MLHACSCRVSPEQHGGPAAGVAEVDSDRITVTGRDREDVRTARLVTRGEEPPQRVREVAGARMAGVVAAPRWGDVHLLGWCSPRVGDRDDGVVKVDRLAGAVVDLDDQAQ